MNEHNTVLIENNKQMLTHDQSEVQSYEQVVNSSHFDEIHQNNSDRREHQQFTNVCWKKSPEFTFTQCLARS